MISYGFHSFGDPAVFEQLTQATPTLKPTQLLIAPQAIGVNPYEAAMRRGETQTSRPLPLPIVPGSDVVGRVVAIGAEVTDFAVGDMVIGRGNLNGYAEYVAVGQKRAVLKPEAMPLEEAAGLPTPGVTAYDVLFGATAIDDAQTIAIIGASGAVGSILVQIARAKDHPTIGVASSPNQDYVTQLGATTTLDYTQNIPGALKGQVDLVINTVAGLAGFNTAAELLSPAGTFISLTGNAQVISESVPQATTISFSDMTYHQTRSALNYLTTLYGDGGLTLTTAATFPFDLGGVVEAHALLESHHRPGKIVLLKPAPES